MTALLLAVFAASLLGSLHCAGMCGPFVTFATLRPKGSVRRVRSHAALQIAYHGGRLGSYLLLGTTAGQLGATLNLGGTLLGMGRAAGIAAGLTLVAIGSARLAALAGWRMPNLGAARGIATVVGVGHRVAARMTPPKRAIVVGLLSGVIPCGWLYAFVAVAAGTGHPLLGALVMAVFWAGTVPVLAGLGAGLAEVLHRVSKPAQLATACAVIVLGLHSLFGRINIDAEHLSLPAGSLHAALQRVSTILGTSKGHHSCH